MSIAISKEIYVVNGESAYVLVFGTFMWLLSRNVLPAVLVELDQYRQSEFTTFIENRDMYVLFFVWF